MSLPQFSSLLQEWARLVNLKAFTSARPKTEEEKAQTPLMTPAIPMSPRLDC